jgi:hypothetical protein
VFTAWVYWHLQKEIARCSFIDVRNRRDNTNRSAQHLHIIRPFPSHHHLVASLVNSLKNKINQKKSLLAFQENELYRPFGAPDSQKTPQPSRPKASLQILR